MLMGKIQDSAVANIGDLSAAGRYADQLLTTDTLRNEFESGVIRRKSFCEALDIGESTLSTWLQSGRIPRVAAVAYVLWLALKKLRDEIQQRDQLAAEPYVIQCPDGYAVVQPADRDTPDSIDQVIASGIAAAELAREIAITRSVRFRKVLDRALDAVRAYEEQYEAVDNWVAEVAADLERARDFKVGPLAWDELP